MDDDGNLIITVNGVSGSGIPLPESDIELLIKMPMTLDISTSSVSREEAQQNNVCASSYSTEELPFKILKGMIFFNYSTTITNNRQGRKAIFNYPVTLLSNLTVQVMSNTSGSISLNCAFEGVFYAALNSGGTPTYSKAEGTMTITLTYSEEWNFSSVQATISNLTFTNDQYFAIANPQIYKLIINSVTPV